MIETGETVPNAGHITVRLSAWREGDSEAFDELVPLIYEDLRSIARQQLSRLRPGQMLDTTALVNESYAKLQAGNQMQFTNRDHFFAIAACAMRQIIVDHARNQMTEKRTGTQVSADLDNLPSSVDERVEQIVFVDQLLERLEQINPELVRLVECRFFAGYTQDETAEVLQISRRTLNRRWKQANAWLRELTAH